MPLRLSVGLTKKVGQPDYGSIGASCHVEVELDSGIVFNDLEGFHRHVRNAFVACRQAVQEELSRNQAGGQCEHADRATGQEASSSGQPSVTNGHRRNGTNGNGSRASSKQLDYARQLARQTPGVGVRKLDALAQRLYGKPLVSLSGVEASAVIDTLKAAKDGELQIEAVLDGGGS